MTTVTNNNGFLYNSDGDGSNAVLLGEVGIRYFAQDRDAGISFYDPPSQDLPIRVGYGPS